MFSRPIVIIIRLVTAWPSAWLLHFQKLDKAACLVLEGETNSASIIIIKEWNKNICIKWSSSVRKAP